MRLVPENVLAARAAAVEAHPVVLETIRQDLLDDALCGRWLRYYLLLTQLPESVADQELTSEDLLWNRYYWFWRIKTLHEKRDGHECAAFAQQAFQMLEHARCQPNWLRLDEVQAKAERDAIAALGS